ncbi:MAG TPA: NAD(P)/FAD-dependent oxidoreductase, partial [Pyrinomonadaceae bacterium]|nr:NAD(P)/FAD-dependent oxidoreductase [Pyrinomonadaceae bacterium]
MPTTSDTFDVAIAGAGPAGTSAAIHLAIAGARVLLVEEKKFPRQKLCGEFISPECLEHFKRLGVIDSMIAAGGPSVWETVFYSRRGKSVAVPSEWFKAGTQALGLSRSEMDHQLLDRAKRAGVVVLEEAHASRLICEGEAVRGIRLRKGDATRDCAAVITIDATGRTRSLARQLDPSRANRRKHINPLVAFKVHLENAHVAPGACEIYFYRGGYGGLSAVEGGVSNLCFIVAAKDVRRHGSDPEIVMREVVMKNSRAAYTLAEAASRTPWLSVSLETFGRRRLVPAPGLLTIGDAAAFIDPFTGSGMLMALESGQTAADVIVKNLSLLRKGSGFAPFADDYRAEYNRKFDSRLRVSGLLRRAAFVPHLDEAAIILFGASAQLRRRLARATRHSDSAEARASR